MKQSIITTFGLSVIIILLLAVRDAKGVSTLIRTFQNDQCSYEGTTVNVNDEINSYGAGLDEDTRDLREEVEELLEDNHKWTTSTDQYKDVVAHLRAILKADRDEIEDEVELNKREVDLENTNCNFLDSISGDCPVALRSLSPLLMNFAKAAQAEDTISALYWILRTLDGMPEISQRCRNDPFEIPTKFFDDDDCEEEIEDLAELIGKIADRDDILFGTSYESGRVISTNIPKIVAYCLGTEVLDL